MLPAFERIVSTTADSVDAAVRLFMALQENVGKALDRVLKYPRLDSVTLVDVALGNGVDTTVNHKLGRTIQGWAAYRPNVAATIYEVSSTDRLLVLHASAAVVVDLEIW